jgi:hypothetical protein
MAINLRRVNGRRQRLPTIVDLPRKLRTLDFASFCTNKTYPPKRPLTADDRFAKTS